MIPLPMQSDTLLPRFAVLQHGLRQGATSQFALKKE